MIRHIVLTRFKPDTPESEIRDIYAGLAALCGQLDGAKGFAGGRSESPEQMERGYQHGFVIDFTDWAALHSYAEHPTHKALGARLVENALGGIDGILVLDIKV